MAGRKVSNAAAVAFAVAVVAMLVVSATAQCGVNRGQVMRSCMAYCRDGSQEQACCSALSQGNVDCLCNTYWGMLRNTKYESCARDIQNKCGMRACHY